MKEPTDALGAVVTHCSRYRYLLWRLWNPAGKRMLVIGYNPSTADARKDDPTVIRCAGFAHREKCGGFEIVNLYALRSSVPSAVRIAKRDGLDPVGLETDAYITAAMARCELVVAAWGANARDEDAPRWGFVLHAAAAAGRTLQCLGTTTSGHPRHPLMVAGNTPLGRWKW